METIYQDILTAYRQDATLEFDNLLAYDRGEDFINMLVSDAHLLSDTSFDIEAEIIGVA